MSIDRVNQVWSTDITYIRLRGGFLYLVAIIDWFSRYVLAWRTSITLETAFCLEALDQAFQRRAARDFQQRPGITVYQYRVYRTGSRRQMCASVGMEEEEH